VMFYLDLSLIYYTYKEVLFAKHTSKPFPQFDPLFQMFKGECYV
jgi:hypothetical protein